MRITDNKFTPSSKVPFYGYVRAKGSKWPAGLKTAFENNQSLLQMADRGYNVTGKISVIDRLKNGAFEDLYKISIKIQKESESFLNRMMNAAGLSKGENLSSGYHTLITTNGLINKRLSDEFIKSKFKIDLKK